jgi:hypothetical protein
VGLMLGTNRSLRGLNRILYKCLEGALFNSFVDK